MIAPILSESIEGQTSIDGSASIGGPRQLNSAEQHIDTRSIDRKDAGAFLTIGEVANALGIRQHVLRYWEEHFTNLRPLTRAGGRRYYRPADVALIAEIDRLLHREGYTIKGAKQALRRIKPATTIQFDPLPTVAPVCLETASQLDSDFADTLYAVRNRLAAALAD